MKTLILPDIHLKINQAQTIIGNNLDCDKVIWLGDFFDDFNDTEETTRKTALYLKSIIDNPKYVFCLGNHDCHYFFPGRHTQCSGFTENKLRVIRNIISQKDIEDHFVFHYWEQDFLISHAGLSNSFVKGLKSKDEIKSFLIKEEYEAQLAIRAGKNHWIYGAGRMRGGRQEVGGLTWCDWHEFEAVPYFPQLFGHSQGNQVGITRKNGFANYNIDTNLKHYAVINDGKIEIKLSPRA